MDWGKNDINGMCCLLIPWDGGICDRGNSCHSGGKLWSPAHTELLYRQHRFTEETAQHTTTTNPYFQTPTPDSKLHEKCTANWINYQAHPHVAQIVVKRWKIAENWQKKERKLLSTWKAGEQSAGRVRGKARIPLWVFSLCFFTGSPFAHRGVCVLVLGSRVRGTTQLLEDNLSPLILSPMWWHSLTSTICWNTSRSSQHCAVSRTPLPCPITDRLLGGSLLPGGRDKDTAQRRETHTHTQSHSHTHTHTHSTRWKQENPQSS